MMILKTTDIAEAVMFDDAQQYLEPLDTLVSKICDNECAGSLALLMLSAIKTKSGSSMPKKDFLDMAERLWDGAE